MFSDTDYTARFYEALGRIRTGLLALTDVQDSHALPMTAHFDEPGPLHFFAPRGGKLASSVASGSQACFYYAGPGHDLFATIHGSLEESRDTDIRQQFWSEEVERWFPGKREDYSVAMLRFTPDRGEVWLATNLSEPGVLRLAGTPVNRHEAVSLS